MKLAIRRAHPEEAHELTALALRSKQSNGYDEGFMAACVEELTITSRQIENHEYWVADAGAIVGCVCLQIARETFVGEISAFFVHPDRKREGIGRLLWQKVMDRARVHQLEKLSLDSDPFAVPFYVSLGFKKVGEVPSGSIAGRCLPRMSITL